MPRLIDHENPLRPPPAPVFLIPLLCADTPPLTDVRFAQSFTSATLPLIEGLPCRYLLWSRIFFHPSSCRVMLVPENPTRSRSRLLHGHFFLPNLSVLLSAVPVVFGLSSLPLLVSKAGRCGAFFVFFRCRPPCSALGRGRIFVVVARRMIYRLPILSAFVACLFFSYEEALPFFPVLTLVLDGSYRSTRRMRSFPFLHLELVDFFFLSLPPPRKLPLFAVPILASFVP